VELLAVLLATLAPGGATRIQAGHPWEIAFVAGLASDPFYTTMGHGIQAEARVEGLPAPVLTGSTTDWGPSYQIPFVEAVIRQRPDLLLIAPTDVAALRVPILAATKAGIKVILVDTTLRDPSMAITTISTDNYAGGVLAADTLARVMGPRGGEVAAMARVPGISSTDQRIEGFDLEAKRYPQLKVEGPVYVNDLRLSGPGSSANSFGLLAAAAARKGLRGMFGTNSGGEAGGFSSAAAKLGIKLVEFDATPAQVTAIKAGHIAALIAQYPYGIGQLGVRLGVEYVSGHHGLKKHYSTPVAVITAANVDDPAMANYLYTQ
jgi:ribose transport system substrate-binding protein